MKKAYQQTNFKVNKLASLPVTITFPSKNICVYLGKQAKKSLSSKSVSLSQCCQCGIQLVLMAPNTRNSLQIHKQYAVELRKLYNF